MATDIVPQQSYLLLDLSMLKQAMGKAPVFEGAGRRWLIRNLSISLALGITAAEAWWHGYEFPRRQQRDEYFKSIGTEWKKLI